MAIAEPSILQATLTPNDLFEVQYTDSWREGVDGVPFYVSAGAYKSMPFQAGTTRGSDITMFDTTFYLTGGDFVYSLQANVFCTIPGATYQWFQLPAGTPPVGDGNYMWSPTPCGTPSEFTWTPADNESIVLRVLAPTGTVFEYPAQVTGGSVLIQQLAGYTVA